MELTKAQVKTIIQNAPPGTSPEGIIAGLRQKGYSLEGYEETGVNVRLNQTKTVERKPEPTLVEKTSNILDSVFGGKQIGDSVGTFYAKHFSQGGKELKKQLESGILSEEEYDNVLKGPTKKQLLGDVGKVGLNIATAAIPGGGGAAAKGAGMVAKSIAGGKTVAKLAGVGAGIGATTGVTEELKAGGSFKDASEEILPGLKRGAVIGLAMPAVSKGLSASAKKLMGSSLKLTKQMEKMQLKGMATDPSKQMLDRKIYGTVSKMIKKNQSEIGKIDRQVNAILRKGSKHNVSPSQVIHEDTIKSIIKGTRGNISYDDASKLYYKELDANPFLHKLRSQQMLSALDMNEVKKAIANLEIGSSKYNSEAPDVISTMVRKRLASVLRSKVKTLEPKTAKLLNDQRALINAHKYLIETAASKRGFGRILAENGILMGGIAGGFATGGFGFPLAAAGLIGGVELANSPALKSSIATLADAAAKLAEKNPNFTQAQILNMLTNPQSEEEAK